MSKEALTPEKIKFLTENYKKFTINELAYCLEVNRSTIYRKLKAFGLSKTDKSEDKPEVIVRTVRKIMPSTVSFDSGLNTASNESRTVAVDFRRCKSGGYVATVGNRTIHRSALPRL